MILKNRNYIIINTGTLKLKVLKLLIFKFPFFSLHIIKLVCQMTVHNYVETYRAPTVTTIVYLTDIKVQTSIKFPQESMISSHQDHKLLGKPDATE